MKQTRHFRRLMSFFLIVTMLLSMTVVGLVGISAADDGPTLTYSFRYDNAGYAEGRVRLTASSELDYDKYILYWADDTKALEGYAPITTITLNQQSKSFTFDEFTAIPAGATKLIAVESALAVGDITIALADAVYDIPESKQFKYSADDAEYTFETLSDIHFHKTNYYEYAQAHFASALEAAAVRGAEFVSTCGDNTNYGDSSEWAMYLYTLANSNFTGPVYEVNGNHEPYDQGEIPNATHTNTLNQYKIATGLNVETEKMQSELYYEVTAANGDHHIYMALELVNNKYHPGISDNFSKAQIDWLEGLLNKYKNDGKKIFIYEHAPFAGYGAGDNKVTPHYGAAMTIDAELYPQTYRFKELLESNKDIIWFSGHTHIDFKYNYNIDNENGTTAYTVHVPSSASTTTVNATGGLDYVNKADSAQGYFVDVYADAVVLNGTDMVKNEILPLYTYLVDYSGEELIENEVEAGEEANYTKVVVTVDASVFDAKSVKVLLYGADDETLSKSVTMIKDEADGLFKANVSTQFTKMKFSATADKFTISSAEYAVADCVVKLGAKKVQVNLADITDKNNGSCTGWTNVNVYAWNTAGGELAAWPGVAMTQEADGTYTAIIPDFPNMIIFNNGTGQTADLDIAPYITETIKGSYTVNSTPTPPVEELPTEPEVPAETVKIYFEKPASWSGAYIYGFYGVAGQTAEKVWPKDYPGDAMKLVEGNLYYYDVPEDIDYIKFCDGDNNGTNHRTDNIPNSQISENALFAITDKGSKYWNYTVSTKADVASVGAAASNYAIRGTFTDWGSNDAILYVEGSTTKIAASYTLAAGEYKFKVYNMNTQVWYGNGGTIEGTCDNWGFRDGKGDATLVITKTGNYTITVDISDSSRLGVTVAEAVFVPVEPTTAAPTQAPATEAPVPEVTTAPITDPATTVPQSTPGYEPEPEPETVTVYFTNNKGWSNAYIYGFYGEVGQTAEKVWPKDYPGEAMTYVRTNSMGQDIYCYDVPADIDYIKFCDGDNKGTNNRTDNISNAEFTGENNAFYLQDKGSKYWPYVGYKYVDETPDDPTTTAPIGTPGTTVPVTTPATTVADETDTVKIYFTNNKGWSNAYIYGFYGEVGQTAEKVWPKDYPGEAMTYVRTNSMGQDIYCYDVPADIDYIKFCDGDNNGTNNRTDNISNAEFTGENNAFYLEDKGSKYWPYVGYKYVDETPDDPTTTAPVTTTGTTVETTAPIATTTAAASTTAPTATTTAKATESAPAVEPIVLLYGDTDLSGVVNVKDATAIQKHIASLITLSEYGLMVADVDANDSVNIKDATAIQKKIADVITEFPSGEHLVIAPEVPTTAPTTQPSAAPTTAPTAVPTTTSPVITDTELTKLLADVKKTLDNENYYASYVAYANLKKVYYEYKDAKVTEADVANAIAEINAVIADYNTMKKNNPSHVGGYQPPKAGTYYLRGTMNNWDESGAMEADGSGYSITYTLAAGTHSLKVYDKDTDKWYGNGGTFTDTCEGWTMSDTAGDLSFTATGGTYKFTVMFADSKIKLTVTKQ